MGGIFGCRLKFFCAERKSRHVWMLLYDVGTSKTKGTKMTDKRLVRTLSGEKLEALVGRSPLGELAEAEIKRRDKLRNLARAA